MSKIDNLTKRFGFFILVYLGLFFVVQWKPLQQVHNVVYCNIAQFYFNIINPHLYSEFIPKAGKNDEGWNSTVKLFKKSEHGRKASSKAYRNRVTPDRMLYRNFYTLAILPVIFLAALFIITPGLTWKRKSLSFLFALMLFYLFLTFHLSHIFENFIMNDGKVGPTLWQKFVALFGFGGLTEPMYVIAALSWAVFALRPEVFSYFKEKN